MKKIPYLIIFVYIAILFSCAGLIVPDPEELTWLKAYPAEWYMDRCAACSITFDDGTMDQYLLAAPELDKRGIKATFFIITGLRQDGIWQDGNISRRLFSWDNAKSLFERGHEIASHTSGHADLRGNPWKAEREITQAYNDLKANIPEAFPFSFAWPYWRSSPEALEHVTAFHYAARSGGRGGSTSGSSIDYMDIASKAVLAKDTSESLVPAAEEACLTGGWFIPNFHGIDSMQIPYDYLGWEAVSFETFKQMLDTLAKYNFWFAAFGDAARYSRQRDSLEIEITGMDYMVGIRYYGGLDPDIFNHPLTLIVEVLPGISLNSVTREKKEIPYIDASEKNCLSKKYLLELPPGDGELKLQFAKSDY